MFVEGLNDCLRVFGPTSEMAGITEYIQHILVHGPDNYDLP
jgi:hypothetical protein